MRTIVAGSRTIIDYFQVEQAIRSAPWEISVLISGGAKGVDELGEAYAYQRNLPLEIYNAEWHKYGNGAGHVRNEQMAKVADALIAVWDGKSKGTANMISNAQKYNLEIHVVIL